MPIEMRIPVTMVGAAAGRITVKRAAQRPDFQRARDVDPPFAPHAATPKAVLMSIGQTGADEDDEDAADGLSLIV